MPSDPSEATIVHLRVETAPYPQDIECPACGTEISVLILDEKTAGIRCVDCGVEIRYDHGDRESEDTTEQQTLMTDGGQSDAANHRDRAGSEGVTQHCECGSETYHIKQTDDRSDVWAECTECGRPTAVFGIGREKQLEWYNEHR